VRRLFLRAFGRPEMAEPLTAEQRAWFYRFALMVACLAITVDLGMGALLSRDPRIDAGVLWTFVGINVPILVAIVLGSSWLLRGPARGDRALIPLIVAAQVTVMVWIQVTGTLTSYFVVAGALLAGFHRAVLAWRYGAISMGAIAAMHLGAFLLEEAGVLPRAPLFLEGPGPVYGSLGMRWSVMMSLLSVYGLTWAGMNILVTTLRETEGALARAERKLAEVAEGARHGRLTGRRLGDQWDLLEVVGRGGMGEVYRAVNDLTREEVAIKVLHPHLADDATMLARFRREADVASRVPASIGPALLGVRISGPGDRFLVMEYLRGEDLAALLRRRGKLPGAEAAALIDAAAEVIGALHDRGIVHRDLKPHNLFVVDAAAPSLRLLDFGIARGADDAELTTAAQIIGTPGYIAPEHLHDGNAKLGPEADVYALAVIAFQLVTGQRPEAAADTALDTPGLDAVFTLALARAPGDRPSSVRELAEAFRAAIEGRLSDAVLRRAEALRRRGPALEDTQLAARS
jgi:tRNA A-37 threonylcarbamoyl transferase component Bud32